MIGERGNERQILAYPSSLRGHGHVKVFDKNIFISDYKKINLKNNITI